ncbi:Ig-like domain-containing protein, partial [Psychrobacter lutiphocae]
MKTVIVKVNSATQTIAEHQVVTKDGQPTVIKATHNVNYELIDQATGRAPHHIVTKRVGQDLHVSVEENGQDSDLIIEDYYDDADSALIGLAEDGNYYYYVPDTGEVADFVTELAPGDIEGQALGGTDYLAPWWVGVTDQAGFGILPWLVGLAGLGGIIAAIDNSGGSSHSYVPPVVDTTAPDAPTATVSDDGTEVTGKAEPGSTVSIKDKDGNEIGTAVADAEGNYTVKLDKPLTNGENITADATDADNNTSDKT